MTTLSEPTPEDRLVDVINDWHKKPEVLSEDWLLENLPEGWTYDCQMEPENAFTITATDGKTLTIPLCLLKG